MPRAKRKGSRTRAKRSGTGLPGDPVIPPLQMAMTRPFGVSPRLRRVLACGGTKTVSITASGIGPDAWFANSGYEPNGAGSAFGGWDDMMDFYSKAYVLGGRLTVQISSTNTLQAVLTVSTRPTTPSTVAEGITAGRSTFGHSILGAPALKLTAIWDVAEVFTRSKVVDDPELFSTRTSAPINQFYVYLAALNANATSTVMTYTWLMEATILFTDPNPVI